MGISSILKELINNNNNFINMKTLCLVLLGLFALAAARPDILNYSVEEGDNEHEHEQEGTAGTAVEGEYSWTAPNGEELVVKYIADHLGYRIVESNALPEAPEFDLEQPKIEEAEEEEKGDNVPVRGLPTRNDEEEDEDAPKFRTVVVSEEEED